MGKTFRKVHHKTNHWFPEDDRRAHMIRKGVKVLRGSKLGSACTDAEGNFKPNTWDDVSSKDGSTMNRDIRNTAKVQIRNQLREMVDG